MGGEWVFNLLGDPATIDVQKYRQELLKIREKFEYDPEIQGEAKWFSATENVQEPVDNIFVKFSYKCEQHDWHKEEPGIDSSKKAWWVLYWDPAKLAKGYNSWGDIHARCTPKNFLTRAKCVAMQRQLAINFPEHFQVYLGDGVDGYSVNELYWGVKPAHLMYSDYSDEASTVDDLPGDVWFSENMDFNFERFIQES